MTEGSAKMVASRLRKRNGEILRAEVDRTVADPAEVDAILNRAGGPGPLVRNKCQCGIRVTNSSDTAFFALTPVSL
jgi:hypothetical protein